jgi:hypothetical protein
MTEQEKINEIIEKTGGRQKLADALGITYGNAKNMLSSGRKPTTWAKAILYIYNEIEKK